MLDILYLDDHLVAINKPSGLLVHRSDIDRHETRFVLQLLRNQLGQRVYPVHRLDKPTSGVLVFALSSEIASQIADQWRERVIDKRYLAIVRGYMPEYVHLDYAMSPPIDKYAKQPVIKPPQEAITDFRLLATIELDVEIDKYPQSRYSLVEAMPKTGRKHQIRRHLKHLSHPIICDARYGKGRHSRYFRDHLNAGRLLLHAWQLHMTHPVTQQPLVFTAPLDNVWWSLVQRFQWQAQLPELLAATLPEDNKERTSV
ncbi:tRNA pseudouridine(65) synthase TruC [Oceanobacter sp. 3_MG-2023]|uniref:tRNA pseudouridine(65) synthase TruC n=1 Tax=Oceanobacter sp. 3_MG-2023 TaxID=3062622 RepID=UPI0027369DD8|nr:tRNA pseudouridine(65) synthase TruC [Oceanobacter sp. 3_MG-2023]MDP2506607.1 tRNA pseudouridine(65) synthase TruC [Oceanobacter sp. 3_MG-2023]